MRRGAGQFRATRRTGGRAFRGGGDGRAARSTADFPPAGRAFVAAPLAGRVAPAVDVSAPLVEAVPLVQESTDKRSVILINWANAPDRTVVPQERLVVTIADGKDVSQVVSLWSGKPLEIERKGDAVLVSIPRLEEGDVLAIE